MTYTTSPDEIVRRKTKGVLLILISVPFIFFLTYKDHLALPIIYLAGISLILMIAFLSKPTGYDITDAQVIINRRIGNVVISRDAIISIEKVDEDLLENRARGGAFGYNGKFNTSIGSTTWYATRRDKIVLITDNTGRKIIVTPDQREEFIKELTSR